MMPKGDPEGRIFLSYPHTNNGFFFLLITVFIYLFILKIISFQRSLNTLRLQFHMVKLLDVLGKIAWVRYYSLSQGKISDILIRCARIRRGLHSMSTHCTCCKSKSNIPIIEYGKSHDKYP